MPQNTYSEDYGTLRVRNVNEAFETMVKSKPTFISVIGYDSQDKVTNTKYEWLNDSLAPTQWTVDGAAASGANLSFDSNAGLRVGDIIGFKASTGASISVRARILTVNANGTDVTIERLGTAATISDNAIAFLIASPREEMSSQELKDNGKPTQGYNFTQIFRRDFALSRTAVQIGLYGLNGEAQIAKAAQLVDYQVNFHIDKMMRELNYSAMLGYREERDASNDKRGTMGGVVPFLELQSATQVDASSAALSATIINNAVEQAIDNGADTPNMTAMVMHTRQARKMTALLPSPQYYLDNEVAGNRVIGFKSDLPPQAGGNVNTIIVDPNFPEDKIAMINPSDITVKTMEEITVEETTDRREDGYSWKMLGELTLEYKNYLTNGILIHSLGL